MKPFLGGLVALAVFFNLVTCGVAQEPPKPGKEHASLKRLEGTWEGESEFGKGTMQYKMGLGGLWLVSDFEGEFGGVKFLGKGLDTYDPVTGKYRSVWVDSFSTAPRVMEGAMDKEGKILTLTGEGRGQEGKPAQYKSILEWVDGDTLKFTLLMVEKEGNGLPLVNISYKRKK